MDWREWFFYISLCIVWTFFVSGAIIRKEKITFKKIIDGIKEYPVSYLIAIFMPQLFIVMFLLQAIFDFKGFKIMIKENYGKKYLKKKGMYMTKYNIHKITPKAHYDGDALIVATSCEQANSYIKDFQENDKDNKNDSLGYNFVQESDVVKGIWGEKPGFVNKSIYYQG